MIESIENAFKDTKSGRNIVLAVSTLILLVTFFKVYSDSYDEKISLGGDNVDYYILGNAIANGDGYTNVQTEEMRSHNHFPVGYPLIIAGTSKFVSNDIGVIKKINGLFLLLSIALLFLIFYKFSGNYIIPFLSCLLILFNFHILSYSTIMMSEIPFLFFLTLSFWIFIKIDFTTPLKKNWLFFVLLVCLSFTFHIRSTGLALFVAFSIFLFLEKNWKYLISMSVGFFLLGLPWFIRTQQLGGSSYLKQVVQKNPYRPELGQMEIGDWFARFWLNFERYITREIPSGTFNSIETNDQLAPVFLFEWIVGICIVAIMIFGLLRLKKYSKLALFYIFSMFGLLLLWPSEWYGVRFMLPLIPVLSFLFIYGVYELANWIFQNVFKLRRLGYFQIGFILVAVIAIGFSGKYSLGKLKEQANSRYANNYMNYFELAKWVKENTSESSVTACRKGQLFYLYSNRYVSGFKNTLDKEEQIKYLESQGVDYVVLDKLGYSTTARYLYPAVERYPEKFKLVLKLENPETFLMEFKPELGYSGEWKDDKKSGKGVFVWENGEKFDGLWKDDSRNGAGTSYWQNGDHFEGIWVDDLRNGPGIYYWKNGQHLEGIWKNDKIEGDVVMKSKEGEVIERSYYENNMKVKVY